jgi:hypothetical protein
MLPKITRILVTTMLAKASAGKKSNCLTGALTPRPATGLDRRRARHHQRAEAAQREQGVAPQTPNVDNNTEQHEEKRSDQEGHLGVKGE